MLGKMAIQLFRKANYSRHLLTKDLEEKYGFIKRRMVGCNTYVLKEKYSYEEVQLLNEIAGELFSAVFGFCEEIGPVAFIGITDEA